MTIWGNHSTTQYPDLVNARVDGESAWEAVDDEAWIADEFIPRVGETRRRDHRGARRLQRRLGSQRGDRPRPRLGARHAEGDWVSMAVPADGSYGVEEGIVSGVPCACSGGEWSIVEGLEVPDFSAQRIDASAIELQEERDAVSQLGLI